MNQNQCVDATLGNEPCRDHGLSKGSRRCEDACVVPEQSLRSNLLFRMQYAVEGNFKWVAIKSLIAKNRFDPEGLNHLQNVIQAPSWKSEMHGMILGASDDPWLVISRQAHGLRTVKLGVLKRGEAQQSVAQSRRKVFFGDIDLVAENYFKLLRQWSSDGRLFAPA